MINKGSSLEDVLSARVSADYDMRFGANSRPWTTAMFYRGRVYQPEKSSEVTVGAVIDRAYSSKHVLQRELHDARVQRIADLAEHIAAEVRIHAADGTTATRSGRS